MEKNQALIARGLEKVQDYQKRREDGELVESSSNSVIYDAIQEYESYRAEERKALVAAGAAWSSSSSSDNKVPEFDVILNELKKRLNKEDPIVKELQGHHRDLVCIIKNQHSELENWKNNELDLANAEEVSHSMLVEELHAKYEAERKAHAASQEKYERMMDDMYKESLLALDKVLVHESETIASLQETMDAELTDKEQMAHDLSKRITQIVAQMSETKSQLAIELQKLQHERDVADALRERVNELTLELEQTLQKLKDESENLKLKSNDAQSFSSKVQLLSESLQVAKQELAQESEKVRIERQAAVTLKAQLDEQLAKNEVLHRELNEKVVESSSSQLKIIADLEHANNQLTSKLNDVVEKSNQSDLEIKENATVIHDLMQRNESLCQEKDELRLQLKSDSEKTSAASHQLSTVTAQLKSLEEKLKNERAKTSEAEARSRESAIKVKELLEKESNYKNILKSMQLTLESEKDKCKVISSAAEADVTRLSNAMQIHVEKETSYEGRLRTLQRSEAELQDQITMLNAASSEATFAHNELEKEYHNLVRDSQHERATLTSTLQTLEEQLRGEKAFREELESTVSAFEAEVSNQSTVIAELQRVNKNLQEGKASSSHELEGVRDTLILKLEELELKLSQQQREFEQKNATLVSEKQSLKLKHEEIQQELSHLQSKEAFQKLKASKEFESLQNSSARIQQELQEKLKLASEKQTSLEKMVSQYQNDSTSMQERLTELQQQSNDMQSQKDWLESQHQQVLSEKNVLQQQLTTSSSESQVTLQQALAASESALHSANSTIQVLRLDLESAGRELQYASEDKSEQLRVVAELQEEVDSLRKELQEEKWTFMGSKKTLLSVQDDMSRLQSTNAKLVSQIQDLKAELENQKWTEARFKNEVADAQDQVKSLKAKWENVVASFKDATGSVWNTRDLTLEGICDFIISGKLQAKVLEATTPPSTNDKNIDRLESTVQNLTTELRESQNKLGKHLEDRTSAIGTLIQERLSSDPSTTTDNGDQLSIVTEENKTLRAYVSQQQEQLGKSLAERERLIASVSENRMAIEAEKKKFEDIREELNTYNSTLAARSDILSSMKKIGDALELDEDTPLEEWTSRAVAAIASQNELCNVIQRQLDEAQSLLQRESSNTREVDLLKAQVDQWKVQYQNLQKQNDLLHAANMTREETRDSTTTPTINEKAYEVKLREADSRLLLANKSIASYASDLKASKKDVKTFKAKLQYVKNELLMLITDEKTRKEVRTFENILAVIKTLTMTTTPSSNSNTPSSSSSSTSLQVRNLRRELSQKSKSLESVSKSLVEYQEAISLLKTNVVRLCLQSQLQGVREVSVTTPSSPSSLHKESCEVILSYVQELVKKQKRVEKKAREEVGKLKSNAAFEVEASQKFGKRLFECMEAYEARLEGISSTSSSNTLSNESLFKKLAELLRVASDRHAKWSTEIKTQAKEIKSLEKAHASVLSEKKELLSQLNATESKIKEFLGDQLRKASSETEAHVAAWESACHQLYDSYLLPLAPSTKILSTFGTPEEFLYAASSIIVKNSNDRNVFFEKIHKLEGTVVEFNAELDRRDEVKSNLEKTITNLRRELRDKEPENEEMITTLRHENQTLETKVQHLKSKLQEEMATKENNNSLVLVSQDNNSNTTTTLKKAVKREIKRMGKRNNELNDHISQLIDCNVVLENKIAYYQNTLDASDLEFKRQEANWKSKFDAQDRLYIEAKAQVGTLDSQLRELNNTVLILSHQNEVLKTKESPRRQNLHHS